MNDKQAAVTGVVGILIVMACCALFYHYGLRDGMKEAAKSCANSSQFTVEKNNWQFVVNCSRPERVPEDERAWK